MAVEVGYRRGVLVTQHVPEGPASGVGVVVVPPYGWDEAASYRARRWLAGRLAEAGHLAVRLDLPGTGDSADPAGDVWAAWQAAVDDAVGGLRAAGCTRVAAVGFGLGCLLAAAAEVDEVALWGCPPSGGAAVRELRALARLERGNAPHPDGLWVYGALIATPTLDAIEAHEIVGRAGLSRALLLGRDGVPAAPEVAAALTASGVTVDHDPGRGWGELMVEPHRARTPTPTLTRIVEWLSSGDGSGQVRALPVDGVLEVPGGQERSVVLDVAGGLPAVLASPARPVLTVVLLNAGALRRTGPHRAWVDCARRWLAEGVATVRVDLPGIGDADGAEPNEEGLYADEYVDVVRAVIDAVAGLGVPSRLALMGLCSGAFWSFESGQVRDGVEHVLLLNPKALDWQPALAPVEASRELRKLLRPTSWVRAVRGELGWTALREPVSAGLRRLRQMPWELRTRRATARARRSGADPVVAGFDRLAARGTGATLVFTGQETLRAELARTGVLAQLDAHPGVALHLIDGEVETHTLAPAAVRAQVEAVVDAQVRALR